MYIYDTSPKKRAKASRLDSKVSLEKLKIVLFGNSVNTKSGNLDFNFL